MRPVIVPLGFGLKPGNSSQTNLRSWSVGGAASGATRGVVGPELWSTGKPLLANDPRLKVGIPGIWYQTGLHCRSVSAACPFDVTGFSFAGLPGIVIGHNQNIAWGIHQPGPGCQRLLPRAGSWRLLPSRQELPAAEAAHRDDQGGW